MVGRGAHSKTHDGREDERESTVTPHQQRIALPEDEVENFTFFL